MHFASATTRAEPNQGEAVSSPREEVQATVNRYHELRNRIDAGLEPDAFGSLADFYTDDAVVIDGAWGRIEGKEAVAKWLGRFHGRSRGLEIPGGVHRH